MPKQTQLNGWPVPTAIQRTYAAMVAKDGEGVTAGRACLSERTVIAIAAGRPTRVASLIVAAAAAGLFDEMQALIAAEGGVQAPAASTEQTPDRPTHP